MEIKEVGNKIEITYPLQSGETMIIDLKDEAVTFFDGYDEVSVPVSVIKTVIKEYEKSKKKKKSKLSPLSQRVGRSENYNKMSARDQWAEDKRKGILDWDGTEEWLDKHGK